MGDGFLETNGVPLQRIEPRRSSDAQPTSGVAVFAGGHSGKGYRN